MPMRLVVEGEWPGRMSISRGWARAEARRWNDESEAGYVRLARGGADFLEAVTGLVGANGDGVVYSPALYPASTRVWYRAGYRVFDHLAMMERATTPAVPPGRHLIEAVDEPDWVEVAGVDMAAFEGFWRMGVTGLMESAAATPRSIVLIARHEGVLAGYAILGIDRGVSFLQRIAVLPRLGGLGYGSDLVRSAIVAARSHGASVVMLNVRHEAERARRLYRSQGFADTGSKLHLMRRQD
jgi:ribosomal protein S18 acetylase RimI-like enzyme